MARKLQLSDADREFFRRQGKKGGKKSAAGRMEKLTKEQRREIASKAGKASAAARWGNARSATPPAPTSSETGAGAPTPKQEN